MSLPTVYFQDLGRMSYQDAWDYQEGLLKKGADQKLVNRKFPDQAVLPDNYPSCIQPDPQHKPC